VQIDNEQADICGEMYTADDAQTGRLGK